MMDIDHSTCMLMKILKYFCEIQNCGFDFFGVVCKYVCIKYVNIYES